MLVSALKREPTIKNKKEAIASAPLPLVPIWLVVPLWYVSLALPNLVYSGVSWYDTLHIVKWAVAAIPVGIAAIVAGLRLAVYGRERIDLRIDLFGAIWLALLAYVMMQAKWVNISSPVCFVHELLCLVAVWAFYVISWNSFPDRSVRPLLWLANINAAINVVFAELQIRGLNEFTRLILPTPGHYIGNTGQQNMFGLWMAICVMSSIYLYMAYATTPSGKKRHPAVTWLNLLLMTINIWGLVNSTSRSALLSLIVALLLLGLITLRQFGRDYVMRMLHVAALFLVVCGASLITNEHRMTEMVRKTVDMVQNMEEIGGRAGIWATSFTMFRMHMFTGVGIGQFKWHYLDAQREAFKINPYKQWQYTQWAHNEYLQWFCEGGLIGGLLLVAMWGVWVVFLVKMLLRREHVAREVIWACSLVALVSFNALWTRPFHRIENILWLSIAFAICNRAMISALAPTRAFQLDRYLTRLCGVVFCIVSFGGLYYLIDGMAGDRMIRRALNSQNALVQRNLLYRAAEHLMVREDALRNLGYHYMRIGVQNQDLNALNRGFGILWEHFRRRPHSEELGFLLDWSQRLQNIPVLEALASYLKPGTFRLETQSHVSAAGNVIDAVILVPLHNLEGVTRNIDD